MKEHLKGLRKLQQQHQKALEQLQARLYYY
jgi:hypothetical protein